MGYIRHHAILVTSYNKEYAEEAHEKATEIFAGTEDLTAGSLLPSPLMVSPANSYYTFVVPPDGSKEGWKTSDRGDECRERFVDWLNEKRYGDSSSPLDWAVVRYGDEEGHNELEAHEATYWG